MVRPPRSADGAFQGYAEELPRLDGKLHGQLTEHVLAKAAHDHGDRVLLGDAALAAIEELILPIFEVLASCSIWAEGLFTSM